MVLTPSDEQVAGTDVTVGTAGGEVKAPLLKEALGTDEQLPLLASTV